MAESQIGAVVHSLAGKTRNLSTSPALDQAVVKAVRDVYGPGYTVELSSGGQTRGPTKNPFTGEVYQSAGATGSARHNINPETGQSIAGDYVIRDPSGVALGGDTIMPLAQYWVSSGLGSVGINQRAWAEGGGGGQLTHLDLVGGNHPQGRPLRKGESLSWFYGGATKEQQKAMADARAGVNSTKSRYDPLTGKIMPEISFPPQRTLAKGMIGDDVRRLQEALVARGADIKVDGEYGRGTEAAVRDFQKANGLDDDGKVGRDTRAVLASTPPASGNVLGELRPPAEPGLPRSPADYELAGVSPRQYGMGNLGGGVTPGLTPGPMPPQMAMPPPPPAPPFVAPAAGTPTAGYPDLPPLPRMRPGPDAPSGYEAMQAGSPRMGLTMPPPRPVPGTAAGTPLAGYEPLGRAATGLTIPSPMPRMAAGTPLAGYEPRPQLGPGAGPPMRGPMAGIPPPSPAMNPMRPLSEMEQYDALNKAGAQQFAQSPGLDMSPLVNPHLNRPPPPAPPMPYLGPNAQSGFPAMMQGVPRANAPSGYEALMAGAPRVAPPGMGAASPVVADDYLPPELLRALPGVAARERFNQTVGPSNIPYTPDFNTAGPGNLPAPQPRGFGTSPATTFYTPSPTPMSERFDESFGVPMGSIQISPASIQTADASGSIPASVTPAPVSYTPFTPAVTPPAAPPAYPAGVVVNPKVPPTGVPEPETFEQMFGEGAYIAPVTPIGQGKPIGVTPPEAAAEEAAAAEEPVVVNPAVTEAVLKLTGGAPKKPTATAAPTAAAAPAAAQPSLISKLFSGSLGGYLPRGFHQTAQSKTAPSFFGQYGNTAMGGYVTPSGSSYMWPTAGEYVSPGGFLDMSAPGLSQFAGYNPSSVFGSR